MKSLSNREINSEFRRILAKPCRFGSISVQNFNGLRQNSLPIMNTELVASEQGIVSMEDAGLRVDILELWRFRPACTSQ
jgi:hypothetical protein